MGRKLKDKKIKKSNPTSIYDIIRKPDSDSYKYVSISEYESFLNTLNLLDLQAHAIKVGLIPGRDRGVLFSSLIRAFTKTKSAQFGVISDSKSDDALAAKFKSILKRESP